MEVSGVDDEFYSIVLLDDGLRNIRRSLRRSTYGGNVAECGKAVYWTLVQYGRAVSRRFSLASPSTSSQDMLCAFARDQFRMS